MIALKGKLACLDLLLIALAAALACLGLLLRELKNALASLAHFLIYRLSACHGAIVSVGKSDGCKCWL